MKREAQGEHGEGDRRRQVDDREELEDRRCDQHEQHADRGDGEGAPHVPGEGHRLFRKIPPVIPRGIRRRSTMAVTSKATSPMVGPVRNAAMPLTPAEEHRRRCGAGEDRGPPGDDGDERLGDVDGPDGREHPGDRSEEPAREPGDRGPDPERDHVDPRGGDPERGGHLRVLHGAPRDEPEVRHLEGEEDRDAERRGDPDKEELVGGRGVLADRDDPEGRGDGGRGGGAEDRGHEPNEEEAQAPGREQGVDHPAVEPADEEPLDDHPDDPHHEGREHQHRDPEVDPGVRGHHHRVAAEHQELAVGEVDDPHHPEDDRQPEADERQVGDPVEDLQADGRD